jgi:hypothetical protein
MNKDKTAKAAAAKKAREAKERAALERMTELFLAHKRACSLDWERDQHNDCVFNSIAGQE